MDQKDELSILVDRTIVAPQGTFDGILTGKKHVEVEFGENKNIICWISTKVETKERAISVLNKKLLGSYNNDIIKVLRIAIRCTCNTTAFRPSMNDVVQLLIETKLYIVMQ
ncbi:hypothetical protein Tco_1261054 [Tanacetum coccineum]